MMFLYDVGEAARLLSYTSEHVRRLIRAGKIKAIKVGDNNSQWRISKEEIERLLKDAYVTKEIK